MSVDIIDALRRSLGWAELVGSDGKWLAAECPICGQRKLSVNAEKGIYRCWRHCYGSGWHPVSDIIGNVDLKLYSEESERDPEDDIITFISPGDVVDLSTLPDNHPAIMYIKGRKMDPLYLEKTFGVMYCEEGRTFRKGGATTSKSLIIPIQSGGEIVGWQSRLIYDPQKLSIDDCMALGMQYVTNSKGIEKFEYYSKYFTMPGYKKGEHLYNGDQASKSDLVVVTEGAFDVFSVGRCAVATFGKGIDIERSGHQIKLLSKWPLVVILMDPDALDISSKVRAELSSLGTPTILVSLTGDPGETPREVIWDTINQSCRDVGVDIFTLRVLV